jgi:hypothetical protein
MPVSLDLRKAWRHQKHGDLIVVLTWVNDQRSLVLLPAHRRNAGWYVLQDNAAYQWGVDHEDAAVRREAMEHAVAQSFIACEMLNLEPSKMNRARVISVITGWIPDLYRMPSAPEPEFNPEAYGHMILRADGKEIAGQDLRTEVSAGANYG